jgi:hypothetical protein
MLRQQVAEMIGEGIFSGATQPELTV